MELWENEVYRFKTIGQLKVSWISKFCRDVLWCQEIMGEAGFRINTTINHKGAISHYAWSISKSDISAPLFRSRPSVSTCPEGTCV